jgi:hypothetical protein
LANAETEIEAVVDPFRLEVFHVSQHNRCGDSSLPPELYARVRSELQEGEQFPWVGQPISGRFARSAVPIVLIAIRWTA